MCWRTGKQGKPHLVRTWIPLFNNCITKWRLNAWNIQELLLLVASSYMETSPMTGKSWQPSHESPHRKGRQAPITLNKQWKEGGKGWGKLPGWWAGTPYNAASSYSKHMQECLKWRAHGTLMHICKKPLTTREF